MYSPGFSVAHDAEHNSLSTRLAADEASITSMQSQLVQQGVWANVPSVPNPDQLYFATDRDTLYAFNATAARWLTQPIEGVLIGRNASNVMTAPGAGNFLIATLARPADYDIWVEKISLEFIHFTSQSGTNFYTISASISLSGTTNTQANTTVGTQYRIEPTITPAIYAATNKSFDVNLQQSGAPGNVEFWGTIRYRLAG